MVDVLNGKWLRREMDRGLPIASEARLRPGRSSKPQQAETPSLSGIALHRSEPHRKKAHLINYVSAVK
jgi:hypothetical protein